VQDEGYPRRLGNARFVARAGWPKKFFRSIGKSFSKGPLKVPPAGLDPDMPPLKPLAWVHS